MSDPKQLFIGNIARQTTYEKLKSVFETAYPGKVDKTYVVRARPSNASRGYGFVEFTDANAATNALGKKIVLDGRNLHIERKTSSN